MEVRRSEERDRGELERLLRLLFLDEADVEWAELAPRIATTTIFVIDRGDGRLGGYVEVGVRPFADGCETAPVAYVEAWYVDTDLRRRRWGGRLIATAEEWARAHGHREIGSDAVISNEASIAAHKALGFREHDRVVRFVKNL